MGMQLKNEEFLAVIAGNFGNTSRKKVGEIAKVSPPLLQAVSEVSHTKTNAPTKIATANYAKFMISLLNMLLVSFAIRTK